MSSKYGRRFGKQKDANHTEISGAFRSLGLSVYEASDVGGGFPDLVVGGSMPCEKCGALVKQNKLVEIKVPGTDQKTNLRRGQVEFHLLWRGPIYVAKTIDEALAIAGKGGRK
jgi:hypothetical protein